MPSASAPSADEQLARELQQMEDQAAASAAQQGDGSLWHDLFWLLLMVAEAILVLLVGLNPMVKLLYVLSLPPSVLFIPHWDHTNYRGLRVLWQQISARGLTSNQCLKWLTSYLVATNLLVVLSTCYSFGIGGRFSSEESIICLSLVNFLYAVKLRKEDHALSQDYSVLMTQIGGEVEDISAAGQGIDQEFHRDEDWGVELQSIEVTNNQGKDVWDDL